MRMFLPSRTRWPSRGDRHRRRTTGRAPGGICPSSTAKPRLGAGGCRYNCGSSSRGRCAAPQAFPDRPVLESRGSSSGCFRFAASFLVAVIIERFIALRRGRVIPVTDFISGLKRVYADNREDREQAAAILQEEHDSPLARMIAAGVPSVCRVGDVAAAEKSVIEDHRRQRNVSSSARTCGSFTALAA